MKDRCISCKYWTPNFLKIRMCGDTFCENPKIIKQIIADETKTPDWVKTSIRKMFETPRDFGCVYWEDSGFIWGGLMK